MNAEETRATLLALVCQIAPEIDPDGLDPDADLRRAADLDSLDFQTLIEQVATATGVEIPEVDYPQVRSLTGLAAYVEAHAMQS